MLAFQNLLYLDFMWVCVIPQGRNLKEPVLCSPPPPPLHPYTQAPHTTHSLTHSSTPHTHSPPYHPHTRTIPPPHTAPQCSTHTHTQHTHSLQSRSLWTNKGSETLDIYSLIVHLHIYVYILIFTSFFQSIQGSIICSQVEKQSSKY